MKYTLLFCAVIALCGCTNTNQTAFNAGSTTRQLGIGIMYLPPTDAVDHPAPPLDGAFANTVAQGVDIRSQWSRVEPSEGTFYWDYLDSAVALASSHNKKFGISIVAGVTTPQWVFDAGATVFVVTEQSGDKANLGLPWDPVFQAKWGACIKAVSARYGSDPNLAYVDIGGTGRKAESYFVTTQDDQVALDALAQSQGYTNGLAAWLSGAKWDTDFYAKRFKGVPILCNLGPPYPTDAGQQTLQSLCDYASGKYARFGVKGDFLGPTQPPRNSIGATEVTKLSPTAVVGYRFGDLQHGDVNSMNASLQRGIGFGAHFIEVYGPDCDDATQADVLTAAAQQLLTP